MLRSIFNDDELTIESVICKVYFPQCEGYSQTWPTSHCELKSQKNKEIRRFNISSNKSFGQFFDLITASIVEPSADVELLYLDSNSDWVAVRDNQTWTKALTSARRVTDDKKQIRVKVTTRDGTSVTPKPTSQSQPRQKSKKNTSCCIIPTKTESYSVSQENFLSIKQDFGDVQKQLQMLHMQQQGQPDKRRKKKVNPEKKKRSNKNAPAEIVTQVVYAEHFTWSPSKWGSGTHASSTSIAVL